MDAVRASPLLLALLGVGSFACGSTDGTIASPPEPSPPAKSETPQPSFGAGGELHLVRLMHATPDAGAAAGGANGVDAATAPGSGGGGGAAGGGSADAGGSGSEDAATTGDNDAGAGSQNDSGCDPGGAQDESRHHHHGR